MKNIRLYQNKVFKVGSEAVLDKDVHHHLLKVLRFPIGSMITLFNGDGYDYVAKIVSVNRICKVEVNTREKNNSESSLDLTLAQGIAKGEKMDFLIQKAVELGVNRIVPLQTERCVVRLKGEKIAKRIEHWQKIANHACAQSGRAVVVEVDTQKTLSELLSVKVSNGFVLHHQATNTLSNIKPTSKATILIGPEGGLSEQEIELANGAGFQSVLLGKRILRTETASLAAIANMQLLWGN
jgi:16S rRNA (uracil1498-N3)-methyltransferase